MPVYPGAATTCTSSTTTGPPTPPKATRVATDTARCSAEHPPRQDHARPAFSDAWWRSSRQPLTRRTAPSSLKRSRVDSHPRGRIQSPASCAFPRVSGWSPARSTSADVVGRGDLALGSPVGRARGLDANPAKRTRAGGRRSDDGRSTRWTFRAAAEDGSSERRRVELARSIPRWGTLVVAVVMVVCIRTQASRLS